MNGPIGIFDSGIGGLTVASALKNQLPNESLLYFGDTAHMPYGDKSEDAIRYYSIRIAQFLLKNQAKAIVIACNSASAAAARVVEDFVDGKVPVINVIDPLIAYLGEHHGSDRIGVIGTKATIGSEVYKNRIEALLNDCKVQSLATPLLAPMIEEGFFNNKISQTIVESYLNNRKLKGIQTLVLACTHYPLIRTEIERFYAGKVHVIDSAQPVAMYTKQKLESLNLLTQNTKARYQFYVSDYTQSFEKSAKLFFGNKVVLQEANFW